MQIRTHTPSCTYKYTCTQATHTLTHTPSCTCTYTFTHTRKHCIHCKQCKKTHFKHIADISTVINCCGMLECIVTSIFENYVRIKIGDLRNDI